MRRIKPGWPHYILKPGGPGLSSANESYGTTFKLFTHLDFRSHLKRELLHFPSHAFGQRLRISPVCIRVLSGIWLKRVRNGREALWSWASCLCFCAPFSPSLLPLKFWEKTGKCLCNNTLFKIELEMLILLPLWQLRWLSHVCMCALPMKNELMMRN